MAIAVLRNRKYGGQTANYSRILVAIDKGNNEISLVTAESWIDTKAEPCARAP